MPETKKKALIAMSGGVDSSVSALLMQQAGYDCSGIYLHLCGAHLLPDSASENQQAPLDAAAVCEKLEMPFHTFDLTKEFEKKVIDYFVSSYETGETPNPCITCNKHLKFGSLLEIAKDLGNDVLVTGHYARVEQDENSGRWLLKTGLDESKDQSYMLYSLSQEQLSHIRLPLGDKTKEECRLLAEKAGLVNAAKKDSQDICFIPDGDYASFLCRYRGSSPEEGDFLTTDGRICGRHRGQEKYTVGQRRGLHLAMGEPVYVISKDAAANTVTVGPNEALFSNALLADRVNWIKYDAPKQPIFVTAKTRYHQKPIPATAQSLPDGKLLVEFDLPVRAITPGQAVVLYDGEDVVGGGTILSAIQKESL